MLKEFREFIMKGNVIDLAVAVVIGAAFAAIVSSLVDDIITPLLLAPALRAAGADDIADLSWNAVKYGKFLSAIIKFINNHQHSSVKEDKGHYHAGMELAYANLASGNFSEALSNAMTEYKRRPKNIDVNECMAWIYYKKGEASKALPYIETALSTGSLHPGLLCRAALVYYRNNQKEKAASMLLAALSNNPVIENELKKEAIRLMEIPEK